MATFRSTDEVLEFAIEREEEAARFYRDQAARMQRPEMKQTFEDFAKEEMGHKERLIGIRKGQVAMPHTERVQDLKIADYQPKLNPTPDMSYGEALVLAMQREKAAFKLYMDLAGMMQGTAVQPIFLALAQEEAKHKLRFEIEYDREMLTEN
jgi:rubrerythrin